MGDLIEWDPQHGSDEKDNNSSASFSAKNTTAKKCKSPVFVGRVDKKTIALYFCHLFETDKLSRVFHDEIYIEKEMWSIEKKDLLDNMYTVFFVEDNYFENSFTEEYLVKQFSVIAKRLIKSAYLYASNLTPATLSLEDLKEQNTKKIINPHICVFLKNYKVKALRNKSREELCSISGMTTEYLFRIEKYLAVHGVFLKAPAIPTVTDGGAK